VSKIQQIFKEHSHDYLQRFGCKMPGAHRKAIHAVCNCRNGAFGQHLFECPDCGEKHVANSSCGNRHCPVCQNDKAAQWVYKQQLRRLPCTYFLSTFTIPDGLWAFARSHQKVMYAAMFKASSDSLKALEADPRFVGCEVAGFFGILHTWGRQLQYHPHIHYVIPGGGLNKERSEWIASSGQFLVHVRALSKLFKGKLRATLKELDLLHLVPSDVWKQDWVVHCKSVGDGEGALKYLGAYVFRVAISDSRIISYDGKSVRFKYYKVGSRKARYSELPVMEFIRRFLQHVLPSGFMKIRHYGFLSPNFSVPIERIRELICVLYQIIKNLVPAIEPPSKPKPLSCSVCGSLMQWVHFFRRGALVT
jgi:hypothetical protein